jgi:hypothetical protein
MSDAKEEKSKKILQDPDYIYCPSQGNSLQKLLEKYPDGVNDEKAAQVLMTTPDKIKQYYDEAVELIKKDIGLK